MLIGIGAPLKAMNKDAEGGCDHQVRAHAFGALGIILHQARGEPNDEHHEHHLDGDADHRDQRADRAMEHILHDHVTDHSLGSGVFGSWGFAPCGCAFCASSPTRTNCDPVGCWSTNRLASTGSFMVTFVIPI